MRPTTSHRSGTQAGGRKVRTSGAPPNAVAAVALAGATALAVLTACSNGESGAAAVAGVATTAQAPLHQPATPVTAAAAPAATAAATVDASSTDASRDPFAGVDPSQVDVLRNIARLDPAVAKGSARVPATAPAALREQRDEPSAAGAAPTTPTSAVGAVPVAAGAGPALTPARTEVAPALLPAALAAGLPAAPPGAAAAAPATSTASLPTPGPSATPASNPSASAGPAVAAGVPLAPAGAVAAGTAAPAVNAQRRALAQPQPAFPREALREGLNEGRVVALLSVDADGRVIDVALLSSAPSRSFGRVALEALRDWRYEPAAAASSIRVELQFRAD